MSNPLEFAETIENPIFKQIFLATQLQNAQATVLNQEENDDDEN